MATLPLSPRDRSWSKSEAIPRVREFTHSESAPSPEYKEAFLLVLKDGKEFGDYHYPIADVIDGTLHAVWHAVTAAAAAVQGARSGANIPEHNRDEIRAKLDVYYAEARKEYKDDSIEAPWKPAEAPKAEAHAAQMSATREFQLDEIRQAPNDSRTVTLSFSSENPVNSPFYENEVLSHDDGAADLSRLNSGAPLLMQHNPANQVGVVERAWIDSLSHKGRATVRFSKNPQADEVYQDVLDGIRRNISVGFDFDPAQPTERNGRMVNLIPHWTPAELSIVSMPADTSVGVGRSKQINSSRANSQPVLNTTNTSDSDSQPTKGKSMSTETVSADNQALDSMKTERARVAGINKIADVLVAKNPNAREIARFAVENGLTESEFSTKVFDEMVSKGDAKRATKSDMEIGLHPHEARKFSFVKLIRSIADPSAVTLEDAKFEREVCDAYRGKVGASVENRGGYMIPQEVLSTRALSASGSDIVATDLLAQDFVEMLRNQTVVRQAGAQSLDGLVGNVNIPTQTGAATAYWLSTDTSSLTESDQVFSNFALTPHTLTAWTQVSRQLLAQSTPSVEQLIRNDLALQVAIAVDEAAINGSGSAGQPKGILQTSGIGSVALGTNGAAPTYASIVEMKGALMKANAFRGNPCFLINGETYETLATTLRESSSAFPVYILSDDSNSVLAAQKYFVSEQVPNNLTKGTGTNLSAVILGNFADLLLAGWGGFEILVDPYSKAANNSVNIYAYSMCDIGVRHAASFAAITDMVTT